MVSSATDLNVHHRPEPDHPGDALEPCDPVHRSARNCGLSAYRDDRNDTGSDFVDAAQNRGLRFDVQPAQAKCCSGHDRRKDDNER
jgi:hypothetical protein